MDVIVKYAIENVCNTKVSYDTSFGWGMDSGVTLSDKDIEKILQEIEYMCTLKFTSASRDWLVSNIKNKKMTVSDFIRDIETQSLLLRSARVAQRNSAGKPAALASGPMSFAELNRDGVYCGLSGQKCDKVQKNKKTDIQTICAKTNCKIAENFHKFVERMR